MNISIFNKSKLFFWVVLLLLVINFGALSTIIYKGFIKKDNVQLSETDNNSCRGKSGDDAFLEKELNLNESQIANFKQSKELFKKKSIVINEEIKKKRDEVIETFLAEPGDTSLIRKKVEEYGLLQGKLKANSLINLYLLKQNCTQKQKHKIDELVHKIIQKRELVPDCNKSFKNKNNHHRHRNGRSDRDSIQ